MDHLKCVAARSKRCDRCGKTIPEGTVGREFLVESSHTTICFERANPFDEHRTSEPEECGEGGAILQAWVALDDHRDT